MSQITGLDEFLNQNSMLAAATGNVTAKRRSL